MFEEILNKASSQASIYQSDDDYTKDGLIHCSLCNTPKQTKINMLGNERIVFCLCKCQLEKCEEEQNELKKEEKQFVLPRSSLPFALFLCLSFQPFTLGIHRRFQCRTLLS